MMHMNSGKGSSAKSRGQHLGNGIAYILDPAKTENGFLVGGNHIIPDAEYAVEQMLSTKQKMENQYGYAKTKGRQGYHFVISFAEKDTVTPQMAMEITDKFIKSYIPDYEAVYAVHNNTKHTHAHIIFNSVNMVTGYKYHYKKKDWDRDILPVVNKLCKEYGLSELKLENIDGRKKKEKTESEAIEKSVTEKAEDSKKQKKKTITELIKEDVEECLNLAKSKQEFDRLMMKRGYTVKRKGVHGQELKNVSVCPPKTGEKEPRPHRLKGEQKERFDKLPEKAPKQKKQEKKPDKPEENKEKILPAAIAAHIFKEVKKEKEKDTDRIDEDFKENSNQENYQEAYQQEFDNRREEDTGQEKSPEWEKEPDFKQKSERIFHYRIKIQQTKVTVDLSGRYLLQEFQRRKSRYYQEYANFDLTRRKIKYLQVNSIKTMEDLQERKEALYKAAEKLENRKKALWNQREPYKKLFAYYKQLEELRIPVQLYREGDTTFSGEYEQMRAILEKIRQSGMTVEELKGLYEQMRGKLSEIGKLEQALKKEITLCDKIEKDSIQHNKRSRQMERENQRKQEKRKNKKVR